MKTKELLEKLDRWHEGIPEELLLEATKREEEIAPSLRAALDEVANNPKAFLDDPERNLYYWATYLLAYFRDEKALPQILRLFQLNSTEFEPVVGDIIAEDGGLLLSSIGYESPDTLVTLLHDTSAPEANREAAVLGLGFLCVQGFLEESFVEGAYRKALTPLTKENSMLAVAIIDAAADLNLRGLGPDITAAYDRGAVEPDDFEFVAEWLHDPEFEPPPPFMHLIQEIDDIVEFFEEKLEMEKALEEGLEDLEDDNGEAGEGEDFSRN